MGNILAGLRDVFRAWRLVFKDRLWPLFLVPGILSLCYLPVALLVGLFYFGDLASYLHERWVPAAWQSSVTEIFLWVAVAVLAFGMAVALYRNVVMIANMQTLVGLYTRLFKRRLKHQRVGFTSAHRFGRKEDVKVVIDADGFDAGIAVGERRQLKSGLQGFQ